MINKLSKALASAKKSNFKIIGRPMTRFIVRAMSNQKQKLISIQNLSQLDHTFSTVANQKGQPKSQGLSEQVQQEISKIESMNNLGQLLTKFSLDTLKKNTKLFDTYLAKLFDSNISTQQQIEKSFFDILNFYSIIRKHTALLNYKPNQILEFLALTCKVCQAFKSLIKKERYNVYLTLRGWGSFPNSYRNELIAKKFIPRFTGQGFQKKLFILSVRALQMNYYSLSSSGIIHYLAQALQTNNVGQKRALFIKFHAGQTQYYNLKRQLQSKLRSKLMTDEQVKKIFTEMVEKERQLIKSCIFGLSSQEFGFRQLPYSQILVANQFYTTLAYSYKWQNTPNRQQLQIAAKIPAPKVLQKFCDKHLPIYCAVEILTAYLSNTPFIITQETSSQAITKNQFTSYLCQTIQKQFDKFIKQKIERKNQSNKTDFTQLMILSMSKIFNSIWNGYQTENFPSAILNLKRKIEHFFVDHIIFAKNLAQNQDKNVIRFNLQQKAIMFKTLYLSIENMILQQKEQQKYEKKVAQFLKDFVKARNLTIEKQQMEQKTAIKITIKLFYQTCNPNISSNQFKLISALKWRDIFQHWIQVYKIHRSEIPWQIYFAYIKNMQRLTKRHKSINWAEIIRKINLKISQIEDTQQTQLNKRKQVVEVYQQQDEQNGGNSEQQYILKDSDTDVFQNNIAFLYLSQKNRIVVNLHGLKSLLQNIISGEKKNNSVRQQGIPQQYCIKQQQETQFKKIMSKGQVSVYLQLVFKSYNYSNQQIFDLLLKYDIFADSSRKVLRRQKFYNMIFSIQLYLFKKIVNQLISKQSSYAYRKIAYQKIEKQRVEIISSKIPTYNLRSLFEFISFVKTNAAFFMNQNTLLLMLEFFTKNRMFSPFQHYIKTISQITLLIPQITLKKGCQSSDKFYQQLFLQKFNQNIVSMSQNELNDASSIKWLSVQDILGNFLNLFAQGYFVLHPDLTVLFNQIVKNSCQKFYKKPIFSFYAIQNVVYNMASLNYYTNDIIQRPATQLFQASFLNETISKMITIYNHQDNQATIKTLIKTFHSNHKAEQDIEKYQTYQQMISTLQIYLRSFVYQDQVNQLLAGNDKYKIMAQNSVAFTTEKKYMRDVSTIGQMRIISCQAVATILRFNWEIYRKRIGQIANFLQSLLKRAQTSFQSSGQKQKDLHLILTRRQVMLLINSLNLDKDNKKLVKLKGQIFSKFTPKTSEQEFQVKKIVLNCLANIFQFGKKANILSFTDIKYGTKKLQNLRQSIQQLRAATQHSKIMSIPLTSPKQVNDSTNSEIVKIFVGIDAKLTNQQQKRKQAQEQKKDVSVNYKQAKNKLFARIQRKNNGKLVTENQKQNQLQEKQENASLAVNQYKQESVLKIIK